MRKENGVDNVAWNSLTSRHRHLAVVGEKAAMYNPQISMIGGLAENTEEAYTELARIAKQGIPVAIIGQKAPDNHPEWMVMQRAEGLQMVCETPIKYKEREFQSLTHDDVPQMMKLVELTNPGPFSPRTIEMGEYIGVKVDGRLIAMGGERMKPMGHTEISAICTHPEHRGKGYAKAITGALTNMVLERGEKLFLNVFANNEPAINLYEKLGYKTRKKGWATALMKNPSI